MDDPADNGRLDAAARVTYGEDDSIGKKMLRDALGDDEAMRAMFYAVLGVVNAHRTGDWERLIPAVRELTEVWERYPRCLTIACGPGEAADE